MRLHDIDVVADRVQLIVQFVEADPQLRESEADVLRQLKSLQWAFRRVRGRLVQPEALPPQTTRRDRLAEAARAAA